MDTRPLIAAVLLTLCLPAANAHTIARDPDRSRDGGDWEFRFGLGLEPKVSEAEYDYDDSSTNVTQDWDAPGSSLEFNAVHRFSARRPHSAFVTFGGFLRGFEGDDDFGTNLELGVIGIQGGAGYSYRPSRFHTLEIGPRLGIGVSGSTESIAGEEDLESDEGGYARVDAAVTNTFNFDRVQFGVSFGLAAWAATQRYDAQTINTTSGPVFFPGADATYSGSGAFATVMMGFR